MENRKLRYIASALILCLTLSPLAEAKRIGGGSNRGMSRSNYSNSYSNSGRNDYRANNQNNYSGQTQPRSSNTGRIIGAGVAGATIGALAGHAMANHNQQQSNASAPNADGNYSENTNDNSVAATQSANNDQPRVQSQPEQKNGFSWFWLLIIALGGFYLYRRFAGKKNHQSNIPYTSTGKYGNFNSSNINGNSNSTNIFGQKIVSNNNSIPHNSSTMADGSNPDAFLRFARQRFNHVQSMNNASNLEEIRRYFTSDMFADIRNDIMNNQDTAEFSNLNTDLVDNTQENGQYVASVRFSGLVSEELGSPQQPFSEIWHFVKPVGGSQQDWLIAGIQQN